MKLVRLKKLTLFTLVFPLFLVSCNPGSSVTPPSDDDRSGPLCLKEEDLGTTTYFTCTIPDPDDEYVLAQNDVEITDVYMSDEKQLKKMDTIPGKECGDDKAYVPYCHPPDYGCLHKDFVFLLKSPVFGDGAVFDVLIKRGAEIPDCIKCSNGTSFDVSPYAGITAEPDAAIEFDGSDYVFVTTTTVDEGHISPTAEFLGTHDMGGTTFNVYKNFLNWGDLSDEIIYLTEESPPFPASVTYHEYHLVATPTGEAPTLILEDFKPPAKKGWWLHWVPECKPLIYLYPEEKTTLTVVPKPTGYVTVSEPSINPYRGWEDVVAYPGGAISFKGEEYEYLYYEGLITELFVPKEGFIVKEGELEEFFDEYLPRVGLNEKESSEFKEYWLGRLTSSPYYFVRFLTLEEIEKIEKLDVSVEPETIIRVRAYFKPLKEKIDVDTQGLGEPPERSGFTLVEWGGLFEEEERPFFDRIFEIVKAFLRQVKYRMIR